jgi:hypothetical protein
LRIVILRLARRDRKGSLNDGRIQNPSNPFGIVPLSRFVPRSLDLSIIQGPFSVAPCQTLISRFATFRIAVQRRYAVRVHSFCHCVVLTSALLELLEPVELQAVLAARVAALENPALVRTNSSCRVHVNGTTRVPQELTGLISPSTNP